VTFATPFGDRIRAGGVHTLRWLAAAALTLLAHAAAVWVVVGWRSTAVAPSEPPPAVMIDLSPVAPSSTAPERNVADGPQMTEATPSPSDRVAERTVQAAAPNPNPGVPESPTEAPAPERPVAVESPATRPEPVTIESPAETKTDSKPQPAQPIETQVPPAPQSPAPAVEDLALPQNPAQEAEPPPPAARQQEPMPTTSPRSPEFAKPLDAPREDPTRSSLNAEPSLTVATTPEAETATRKPVPPPKTQSARLEGRKAEVENKRVVRTKSAKVDDRPEADHTRAPSGSAAPAARTAASPNSSSGASLTSALASWKGELVAHINRFKRFPPNAASSGTASVAFAINRAGAVVSARLISSSGDRALDEEAVALLHRASPTPPPPAQMGGSVISLTVPIRFDR
jgi:periplasmic protein TonB